jgi:hypothetical protein
MKPVVGKSAHDQGWYKMLLRRVKQFTSMPSRMHSLTSKKSRITDARCSRVAD